MGITLLCMLRREEGMLVLYSCSFRDNGYLGVDTADEGTGGIECASVAFGAAGVADLSAVADEVDVEGVDPGGRSHSGEDEVGLISVYFWAYEAKTVADAVDVGVYWHDTAVEVEHENTGCGFWADAGDAAEVVPGFFVCAFCQFVGEEV